MHAHASTCSRTFTRADARFHIRRQADMRIQAFAHARVPTRVRGHSRACLCAYARPDMIPTYGHSRTSPAFHTHQQIHPRADARTPLHRATHTLG
eukprot:4282761-Pleurochrysis_carterae.AAC.3